MSNIIQLRSVPVSCFKLGTLMSIWFARAESFGICFFYLRLLELYFAKTQKNVRFEIEVCPYFTLLFLLSFQQV